MRKMGCANLLEVCMMVSASGMIMAVLKLDWSIFILLCDIAVIFI